MGTPQKIFGSISWLLCLSAILLESSPVGGTSDSRPMCTDVSFWKPVEYNITNLSCCTSRVELKCQESMQEVCIPVEEMECEVIGWPDCEMYRCPVEVSKPDIINNDFTEMSCKMVPHDFHHIKIIPECKNVTKKICATVWDRDADGNPVWKGEEDCDDVTWLECHDTEVPSVIPSMKSECTPGITTPFQTCSNGTTIESHMCQRCTPKAAPSCRVVKRNECIQVALNTCKPETVEDCSETQYHIPTQEFVHQDKCLFDQLGHTHRGERPRPSEEMTEARGGRHFEPRNERSLMVESMMPRNME